MQLAPNFGPNFRWINDSNIIADFRKVRGGVDKIVQILAGKMAMP
jgi:hypothetical protein